MRVGAFDVVEPTPELRDPHALVMIRPWVDVGSVGSLTLGRLERHFSAKDLAKLDRPGTFFDFTRYRPTVRNVEGGGRETTFPNSHVRYAQPETGPDLLFMHLLEPHAMAEDYIDSIVALLERLRVKVYCRLGAMYDSVPHTRPIVVTGTTGVIQPRPGALPPLTHQTGSNYEGPTTIMNLLTEAVTKMGAATMNLMAHLPHYAQLEEDHAGTARMLQVLGAFYDIPSGLARSRRGERQYEQLSDAVERDPAIKSLVARLEAHYDATYEQPDAMGGESSADQPAVELSSEIERFLKGLDQGL
jgi:PAC2 family